MHTTLHPDSTRISEITARRNDTGSSLVRVRVSETGAPPFQASDASIVMDEIHWQTVANELAVLGIVGKVAEEVASR